MPMPIPIESYAPSLDELKASARATRAAQARNASGRRRFVDPATCERDYSAAEVEFMRAIQEYKRASGRLFPTWSEVLEVVHGLGYRRPAAEVAP
jgi:outer membrane protein TolC